MLASIPTLSFSADVLILIRSNFHQAGNPSYRRSLGKEDIYDTNIQKTMSLLKDKYSYTMLHHVIQRESHGGQKCSAYLRFLKGYSGQTHKTKNHKTAVFYINLLMSMMMMADEHDGRRDDNVDIGNSLLADECGGCRPNLLFRIPKSCSTMFLLPNVRLSTRHLTAS